MRERRHITVPTLKKPKQPKGLDPNEALRLIRDYTKTGSSEPIPEGYYTRRQLAEIWGKGLTAAREICVDGIKMGIVDVLEIRQNGKIIKVYGFRAQK